MKLLDKIPTISKLGYLVTVALLGMGLLAYTAYSNVHLMKKKLDLIYFGSHVPITKLQAIITLYHTDILETVYKSKEEMISPQEAFEILKASKRQILKEWDYYSKSYKREDEIAFVLEINSKITESLRWLDSLMDAYESLDQRKISSISIPALIVRIDTINQALRRAIKYEQDNAYHQKTAINELYEDTLSEVLLISFSILLLLLGIAYPILINIRNYQQELLEMMGELKFANKNLKELSIIDPLTQVYNRRYFNTIGDKELKKAVREKRRFCFFMLDVDCFKLYNDTYGHQKGDDVLKGVGECLKTTMKRPEDYIFRLGGEEFGGIIADSDPSIAERMCSQLLKNIEALKIEHEKNTASDYVTASLGVVTLIPSQNAEIKTLVKEADDLLYQAKEEGRNKIRLRELS